jgi:hypothetical protein
MAEKGQTLEHAHHAIAALEARIDELELRAGLHLKPTPLVQPPAVKPPSELYKNDDGEEVEDAKDAEA